MQRMCVGRKIEIIHTSDLEGVSLKSNMKRTIDGKTDRLMHREIRHTLLVRGNP